MPLTEQQAIERLWRYGHFANPANPDTLNVGGPTFDDVHSGTEPTPPADLAKLTINHPLVKQALRSYQEQMGQDADRLSNEHHARPMIMDGEYGPATEALLEVQRCAVPDYQMGAEPAVGTGSWARCHGVGDYHRATAYIAHNTMPSFLKPVWSQVWANVVASYRELGLDWVETDNANTHNTSLTWTRGAGWIGLAIVGRSQSCGSKIWSRYEQNYKGGSTNASIIQQWTSLVKHELGHNTGLQHSRGGVMNPSIVNGLPTSWRGDPSEPQLKRWFGGEPIPGGEPEPPTPPGPGPVPPTGGGPLVSFRFEIPVGTKPGTYDFIGVPKPVV